MEKEEEIRVMENQEKNEETKKGIPKGCIITPLILALIIFFALISMPYVGTQLSANFHYMGSEMRHFKPSSQP